MAIKLNQQGFDYARHLIKVGEFNHDHCAGEEAWTENKPTVSDEARFLETHNMPEYGQWFLALDTENPENDKKHYVYAYGDFNLVHESGLKAVKEEAKRNNHKEIEHAAQQLLDMIEH